MVPASILRYGSILIGLCEPALGLGTDGPDGDALPMPEATPPVDDVLHVAPHARRGWPA